MKKKKTLSSSHCCFLPFCEEIYNCHLSFSPIGPVLIHRNFIFLSCSFIDLIRYEFNHVSFTTRIRNSPDEFSFFRKARLLNQLNEKELQSGAANTTKSWHHVYRDSAWVYVGGLDFQLTEGDVLCVFSQ